MTEGSKGRYTPLACAALLASALAAGAAQAQTKPGIAPGFPGKPLRILVGLAPGGGVDLSTRAMSQKLNERTGVAVIVENLPGADGVLAMDRMLAAPPDGTTSIAGGSQIEHTAVYKRVPYDVMKALAPVAQMTTQPYLLMVNNKLPAQNLKELVAFAKSRPGELNYATAGVGSSGHLGHEIMNEKLGIRMTHIPYKGSGAALADLIAGRVQLMFLSTLSSMPHVRSGALRPIAITSLRRSDTLPDVPTISESGLPKFEMSNSYGIFTNAKVPAATVNALNREIVAVMNSPEMKARLAADGAEAPPPHTPAEYRAGVQERIEEASAFVQARGIKPQ
jgi:tripartite-type tricarboxylate transporter receptor subunit TctC